MKILIRSLETEPEQQWFRGGEDIDYYNNGYEIVSPNFSYPAA